MRHSLDVSSRESSIQLETYIVVAISTIMLWTLLLFKFVSWDPSD